MRVTGTLLAGMFVLVLTTAAGALTLTTVLVPTNAGQLLDCIVTNIGTTPSTVTVQMVDFFNNTITPSLDQCNGTPLAAGHSCQVQAAANVDAFCRIVSSSTKVRAAISVLGPSADGFPLVTVVPATPK